MRRPIEQPFWAAIGVGGVIFSITIVALSVKNLFPETIDSHLIQDLTFLLPIVDSCLAYAVFKTIREGYMYERNRRYYRLRPPR